MASTNDYWLVAHLMRRAGFGCSRDELEALVTQGYDQTVEQLVDPPPSQPRADIYELFRVMPSLETGGPNPMPGAANWLYHMVNTQRPLEEKMAFFWHHVFATGNSKVDNDNHLITQIDMFREHGMGNFKDLLLRVARSPAMIYWLDNNENHKRSPNENWGRELLELFSLGVGNYTEKDVFECARAFTGWTIAPKLPRVPNHRFSWRYQFRPEEHDYTQKTFLGHTGNFDGEDIIDIILEQPACSRFVVRHLYNFFVADEAQVPAWNIVPPRDPDAIDYLADILVNANFDLKPVLQALFTSDFFKQAQFGKVKGPVEVVVGTLRMTGEMRGPDARLVEMAQQPSYMGQALHNPPSVEGWQTGRDWINSGSVVNRINFVADLLSNTDLPGVQRVVQWIADAYPAPIAPETLVDACLTVMGPLDVSADTREELVAQARIEGSALTRRSDYPAFAQRIGDMLALVSATPEFQFG